MTVSHAALAAADAESALDAADLQTQQASTADRLKGHMVAHYASTPEPRLADHTTGRLEGQPAAPATWTVESMMAWSQSHCPEHAGLVSVPAEAAGSAWGSAVPHAEAAAAEAAAVVDEGTAAVRPAAQAAADAAGDAACDVFRSDAADAAGVLAYSAGGVAAAHDCVQSAAATAAAGVEGGVASFKWRCCCCCCWC